MQILCRYFMKSAAVIDKKTRGLSPEKLHSTGASFLSSRVSPFSDVGQPNRLESQGDLTEA